ncbi:hypothetical protein [Methanosphaerula palustris]|uniref:Uncharacterized protein n=1 Tax=Methanosphaerula palustris (strain ATCC BAA-1556 / DSM 19958 / E1-9c) TaxID=521011 RepID=B8GGN0_METPE|nr:hypothetical protein [Methanosphaerula palustris]ACL16285.1 hypothetical protein Mpal_0933 [Methanosphaerula palustris E1-9c]
MQARVRKMQPFLEYAMIPLSKYYSSWMEKIPSFTPSRSSNSLILDRMEERIRRLSEELELVRAEAEMNHDEFEGLKKMFEHLELELDGSYQYH